MSGVEGVSRIYVVKTTVGQEANVAEMISAKIEALGSPYSERIKTIIYTPEVKGYIFVESSDPSLIDDVVQGVRHARGRIRSKYSFQPDYVAFEEIEKYLRAKPTIEALSEGDLVEILGGPFKSMRARIVAVDKGRGEVTVELLDTPFPMPITMYAEYVRKISER